MMKYLLHLLILLTFIGYSQNSNQEITQLEKSKIELNSKIKEIKDSIIRIDEKIILIKSLHVKNKISNSLYTATARKGGKLKKTPEAMKGDVLLTLKEETTISILDYHNEYFGVCIDDKCGFMSELWINKDENLKDFIKQKRFEENEIRRIALERNLKLKKDEADNLEKKYNKKFGILAYSRLKKGQIWIGMTKEMAMIAKGNPNDINRTIYSWSTNEQWVYENYYLYFENGRLTAIQD